MRNEYKILIGKPEGWGGSYAQMRGQYYNESYRNRE
jgi:hypothetical protein